MRNKRLVTESLENMMLGLGLDLSDPNFIETPERVAKWMFEFIRPLDDIMEECNTHAEKHFPVEDDDMLAFEPFIVYSLCPHHLLPITYSVAIGYLPKEKAIGLSKIVRITRTFAQQLILQEEFGPQLATVLQNILGTEDVAVKVRGIHGCMKYRGVQCSVGVNKLTIRGRFKTIPGLKEEFYLAINSGNKVKNV